jgi:hypothetical protein
MTKSISRFRPNDEFNNKHMEHARNCLLTGSSTDVSPIIPNAELASERSGNPSVAAPLGSIAADGHVFQLAPRSQSLTELSDSTESLRGTMKPARMPAVFMQTNPTLIDPSATVRTANSLPPRTRKLTNRGEDEDVEQPESTEPKTEPIITPRKTSFSKTGGPVDDHQRIMKQAPKALVDDAPEPALTKQLTQKDKKKTNFLKDWVRKKNHAQGTQNVCCMDVSRHALLLLDFLAYPLSLAFSLKKMQEIDGFPRYHLYLR